jgi:hypothetical protein
VTVPVDNLDADLVPSIEVLSSTEILEESAYPEISASEVISANNESGSSEDDIPSFSEWTLKVLADEEKSGKFCLFKIGKVY